MDDDKKEVLLPLHPKREAYSLLHHHLLYSVRSVCISLKVKKQTKDKSYTLGKNNM